MSREMKDSGIEWIGKIPYSWQIKSVKNEFTRKQSQSSNLENSILTLARSGVKIRDISTGEGQIASDYSKYNYVTPGDLLLNPMDLVSGDNCNISNIYGVISPAYFNLGVKKHANPYFFNYYFKIQYWIGSFFAHGKGVSFENRWTLNYETLRNFPILFPPLNEQQKIVKFLDDKLSSINSLTEQTYLSINELKKYKQSLITEAVTKGLDPTVEMKDSRIEWIDNIPRHWDIRSIGNHYFQVKDKNLLSQEENLLSLSYGKIVKRNYHSADGLLPTNFNNYIIVEPNDIVLRMTDLQNDHKSLRTGFVNESGIITSAYIILRPKKNQEFISKFIQLFLHSFDIYKGFYGMGSGVRQNVTFNDIKKLKIILPPIIEQKQIIRYLENKVSTIDNLIENKIKVIEELENYKKSLVYEYVTGKKEV